MAAPREYARQVLMAETENGEEITAAARATRLEATEAAGFGCSHPYLLLQAAKGQVPDTGDNRGSLEPEPYRPQQAPDYCRMEVCRYP